MGRSSAVCTAMKWEGLTAISRSSAVCMRLSRVDCDDSCGRSWCQSSPAFVVPTAEAGEAAAAALNRPGPGGGRCDTWGQVPGEWGHWGKEGHGHMLMVVCFSWWVLSCGTVGYLLLSI
jgi:hypothetical protein